MEKLCQKCGKQLQPDQSFCDQCGSPWTAPETAAGSPVAGSYTPQTPPPVVAARSSKWPMVLVVILAIAAIGMGTWYFVTKRSLAATNLTASSSTSTVITSTTATTVSAAPVAVAAVEPPVTDTATATTTDAVAASDAATEAAAGSKQCSLVTRAEMGTILGKKIVRVIVDKEICSYFTDADRSAQVETTWTGGKDALTAAKGFNEGLMTAVPNIGDEAYMQAAGVLHVLKGDTYVIVNSREYPNDLENESAIARKVMEKMK
jgi:hypothetical protein